MEGFGLDTLALLGLVAFVAGIIDAIGGGGGLLTVPALALAGLDPVAAVATNKLNASFGTASATLAFARAGHLDLERLWPLALAAGIGGLAGALALPHVPRALVSEALPVVLVAVALYFAFAPGFGDAGRRPRLSLASYGMLLVPLIGFYDGVFGPGAGSFYMAGFAALCGFGALKASAHTKLANFASNCSSFILYALGGHVVWLAGLIMAPAQFAGAQLGARLAIRNGARIIRPLLVITSAALALRLVFAPGNATGAALRRMWLQFL